jgi:hypothetical protein
VLCGIVAKVGPDLVRWELLVFLITVVASVASFASVI